MQNQNKIIYLGTTYKCSACKCQERLLNMALVNRADIDIQVCDYKELPKDVTEQVNLNDFPITIITKDNKVEHYFEGTMPISKINQLIDKLNY